MSRQQRFFLGASLLLLLGLLTIYLLGQLQPYTETIQHGPAPEVDANPYLAAETFLRQQGLEVRHADNLKLIDGLPSKDHTLLLFSERFDMNDRQVRQLMDWTSQGGHLVLVAERLWDETKGHSGDPLLDPLGIQQFLSRDLQRESSPAKTAPPATNINNAATPQQPSTASAVPPAPPEAVDDRDKDPYSPLTKLYLEHEEAPVYAEFDTDYHLNDSQDRAHAWANSGDATHMLQLFVGDGLLTVLTDAWLWQNSQIGAYDNAWLLWYLTQDSVVSLIYRADHESLLSLLLRHFPQALSALALLLAATLWYFGMRQGPLLAPSSPARRQLEEHLRGSADFLLRRSGQKSLLASLQKDIRQRAQRRHPGFERLPVADQWQLLGRFSRLPPSSISQLMRPPTGPDLSAAVFTNQVAQLQNLRNQLDRVRPASTTRQPHKHPL